MATWAILAIAVFWVSTFLYVYLQALCGRVQGIDVQVVNVGYPLGKLGLGWQGKHWEWRFGLFFFLGGYTRFRGQDDVSRTATTSKPTELTKTNGEYTALLLARTISRRRWAR